MSFNAPEGRGNENVLAEYYKWSTYEMLTRFHSSDKRKIFVVCGLHQVLLVVITALQQIRSGLHLQG